MKTKQSETEFKKKINKFKKKTWILACHKNEIKNNKDFKTLDFFDVPAIIYNFNKEYFSFKNVCLHRGSKLKIKRYGNGPFNCIYHGWSYNKKGRLISGPKINEAFPKKKISNLTLDKFKVEECGSFIFITDKKNKVTLKNFLGGHYFEISNISKSFGKLASSEKYNWKCNWQIAIENSIDEYHGPILHKGTFKKILDLDPSYSYSNKVSEMNMPLNKNYLKIFSDQAKKKNYFKLDNKYRHYFIFPISTIASTMGTFCYLQRYIPVNVNETQVETDIFIPEIHTKKKTLNNTFLENSAKKFNHEVFLEDQEVCENLNENLNKGYKHSIIGKFEKRINFFRDLLLKK